MKTAPEIFVENEDIQVDDRNPSEQEQRKLGEYRRKVRAQISQGD